jgi:TusA-related sulfurtransferase
MTIEFDARALKCPLLFVKTRQMLKHLLPGQQLMILVNDKVGIRDIKRYLDKQNFRYTSGELKTSLNPPDVQFCIQGKEM